MPNVVFLPDLFHRYKRICEDFKFLTNVCHKHDFFDIKYDKTALFFCICCLKYVWGEFVPAPGRTWPDMRQVSLCLDRSTKSQIWVLASNSFGIFTNTVSISLRLTMGN